MDDTTDDMTNPSVVPLMPTGNGAADLEISREQAAIIEADEIVPQERSPMNDGAIEPQPGDVQPPVDNDRPALSE